MMMIFKSKKGMTLLEVILAVAIFAVVTLPLLSSFVQSVSIDRKAEEILKANYISQEYLEKLDTVTYSEALENLPNNSSVEEYKFTAKIKPYGNLNSLFGSPCAYVHLIIYTDGSALCVMPDGKWHKFTSVPSSFSLSFYSGEYSFTGGYTTLTGSSEYNHCALIVNAMKKPDETASAITLSGSCKAVLYCTELDSGEITFSGGTSNVYEDMITGNTSLIFVTTALYNRSGGDAIATTDSYIHIRNW